MKTIPLTRGKFAIVDDADYRWLRRWKWYAHRNKSGKVFYAVRDTRYLKGGKQLTMSAVIMKPSPGFIVDHKNFNTLDNRRSNLRICTDYENKTHRQKTILSKSGFKGVYPCYGRWKAKIRNEHLGVFDSKEAAARAYDKAARSLYGKFACTNF
jgi:hypothetical protein